MAHVALEDERVEPQLAHHETVTQVLPRVLMGDACFSCMLDGVQLTQRRGSENVGGGLA